MGSYEARSALKAALEDDDALAARFASASSEAEFKAIVEEIGIDWDELNSSADATAEVSGDLTDTELASMSGGFLMPSTDWFSCEGVKPPWAWG